MAISTGVKPFVVQRRMMELGRVRLGTKGTKGEPKKLDTFRFTSASKSLLESVAQRYGGKVAEWTDAPDEGYFELVTEAAEIDIEFPPVYSQADGTPTVPYSQFLELWSAGGCQRRCDGEVEALTGKACLCDPDNRACQITTRISFLMPDIRGLGVWRLESHGWNAAAELPGTLEVLTLAAAEGRRIPATLRIEHRTKKSEGQTRRFIVPVVELRGLSLDQLASGEAPLVVNGPLPPAERPQLPRTTIERPNESFEQEEPERPPSPALPGEETNGATPLSKSELDLLIEDGGITKEQIGETGRTLFPGKSFSKLTNAERGELWQALQEVPA